MQCLAKGKFSQINNLLGLIMMFTPTSDAHLTSGDVVALHCIMYRFKLVKSTWTLCSDHF